MINLSYRLMLIFAITTLTEKKVNSGGLIMPNILITCNRLLVLFHGTVSINSPFMRICVFMNAYEICYSFLNNFMCQIYIIHNRNHLTTIKCWPERKFRSSVYCELLMYSLFELELLMCSLFIGLLRGYF